MQTLEAIISLLFFLSILSSTLPSIEPQKIDDSLYRLQLADDCWRVLYLRGDFHNFSEASRLKIENDMSSITEQTGLCIFLEGIQFTSCRDGQEHEITASLRRTLLENGAPKRVVFSIGK